MRFPAGTGGSPPDNKGDLFSDTYTAVSLFPVSRCGKADAPSRKHLLRVTQSGTRPHRRPQKAPKHTPVFSLAAERMRKRVPLTCPNVRRERSTPARQRHKYPHAHPPAAAAGSPPGDQSWAELQRGTLDPEHQRRRKHGAHHPASACFLSEQKADRHGQGHQRRSVSRIDE